MVVVSGRSAVPPGGVPIVGPNGVNSLSDTLPDRTIAQRRALAKQAQEVIDAEFAGDLRLADLATRLATSERHLQRSMQDAFGHGFRTALTRRRLAEAERMLRCTQIAVKDIAVQVGYRRPSHFSKAFKDAYDESPRSYRSHATPSRHSGGPGSSA